MSRWNPDGSLAVVTGASSGIGRCLCLRLVERGCRVIAVARREERLQSLRDETANSNLIVPIVGDVTQDETRSAIVDQVDQLASSLDLLVNNAGVGAIGSFEEASEARLRRVMEVNFFAPVELTRQLLPKLHASADAVVCNIGSVLGHRAVPDKSEYCASKFAIHGWSDSLRAELAGSTVRVVLVSPSTTRSEFFDSLVDTDPDTQSASIGSWPPERVSNATLAAIERRSSEAILSAGGKLLVYADRICPPLMNRLLEKRDG